MVAKKRGKRGFLLDSILGSSSNKPINSSSDNVPSVSLNSITPGRYQPRIDIHEESLDELASSIKAQGVIQPIVIRPITSDAPEVEYEIIAGERRWCASKIAGLTEIPAVVRRGVTDQAAIAMALIENIQREDLYPLEEANSLKCLIDEFKLTHQEVAEAIGRSRSAVSNLLRLLELGIKTRQALEQRKIETGHARALLPLPDYAQDQAVQHIIKKSLSVRKTEKYVKGLLNPKLETENKLNPIVEEYQKELADELKSRVNVNFNNDGKGSVTIYFKDLEKLDQIINKIKD